MSTEQNAGTEITAEQSARRKKTKKQSGGSIRKKKKHVVTFAAVNSEHAARGRERLLTSHEPQARVGEGGVSARGPPSYGIERRLRYSDLVALGIVNNRVTLANWQKYRGFPRGQLLGPNYRTWTVAEVQAWLDSRPIEPRETPNPKRRGRPRKDTQAEHMIA
jgi:hypothetical protein